MAAGEAKGVCRKVADPEDDVLLCDWTVMASIYSANRKGRLGCQLSKVLI